MILARGVLAVLGVVAAGIGGAALVEEGWANFESALVWLVVGVVLHDGFLAPLTVVFGLLIVPVLPTWLRPAVVAGAIVLASVTLMAVPVLGRFGARADNPTLLDRDYTAGWLVFAGCVVACAVAWAVLVTRRRQRGGS